MARKRSPQISVRTEWHQSAKGCWSLTLGDRGSRVRVWQRAPGSNFLRETWIPGQGRTLASLHTTSRPEARRAAEAFLRALLTEDVPAPVEPLTLGELWTRYTEGAPAFKKNTPRTQAEKRSRMELLLLGLGPRTIVPRLTLDDVQRYAELRRRGTGWPDGRVTGSIGPRSIAYDLQVLRAAVRWACTVRRPDGEWLLAENPLRGLSLPRELNPRRPLATYDRFLAVSGAIGQLAQSSEPGGGRGRWMRLELALVLAEATGRRIGAIAGLRWQDITTDPPAISWRAEFDKRRREQSIPIPQTLADELRSFRARLGAFDDGWLFPLVRKNRPWSRKVFDTMLREAERKAKVEKLEGGLWHPYRRAWATARKHLPVVDVMKAGGWADRLTLETCYQQATDAGVLEVMASTTKLRERKVSGKE